MSRVMNVILTFRCLENANSCIGQINRALQKQDPERTGFSGLCISQETSFGILGGDKILEVMIYVAAFNYMPLDCLCGALRAVYWRDPENVQLFIKDEHDVRFHEAEWRHYRDAECRRYQQ